MTQLFYAGGVPVSDPMAGLRKYLREKRLAAGYSQEAFAKEIGWSRRSLIDWELGKTATIKSAQLIRAVLVSKASFKEVLDLLNEEEEEDSFSSQIKDLPDEQLEELLALYELLRDNPKAFNRWVGYGYSLRDE